MDISHKNLEHLLALDRHRHYGRAAEALGISQPALSRSILALEDRLGISLFRRSRTRVEPTAAGRLVLRHARDMSLLSTGLKSELAEMQGQAQLGLSVVCGHYPAELTVPCALSALMKTRPGVQVKMEVSDWSRGIQSLEQEFCDLAIIELSAESRSIELQRELLNDRQVFAVVNGHHPLAKNPSPTQDDVLGWPWACSVIPKRAARQLGPGPLAAGEFDEATDHFIPRIVASSLSTSLRLVMENDIVGIAPLSIADPYLRDGRLHLVRFNAPWMRLNYGFAWETGKALNPTTRDFMEEVRKTERRQAQRDRQLRKKYGVDSW